MSLLTQVLMNPLDAGYYSYSDADKPSSIWHKLIVFAVSACLGIGGASAVSSLRSPSRFDVADTLAERAEQRADTIAGLDHDIVELRTNIATAAGEELTAALDTDLATKISNATTPLSGPGLRITISDSRPAGTDADRTSRGRVRDHDLRMIVNALWAAKAEGISVNGIRIGPGSFIRTAGQSIVVNIKPIQPPYIVEAIGDAPLMSVALIQGETGDYLSSIESAHGIGITPQAVSELSLPAVDPRALRHTTTQEDTP